MGLDVTVVGAFLAGLLSFASPCILPLVPAFLAFAAGLSVDDLAGKETGSAGRVLVPALAFVAGFTTVFVLLGATASVIGKTLTSHLQMLSTAAGLLIIVMGLHFVGLIRISWLDRTAKFDVTSKPAGLLGAYIIGLAFAFGWSPCVGPVLTAILLIAGAEDSVGEGALLLFIYALGLGAPFLIAALFAGQFMRWMARMRAYLGVVEKAIGVTLIATGALFVSGHMPSVSYWLLDVFPGLGKIG